MFVGTDGIKRYPLEATTPSSGNYLYGWPTTAVYVLAQGSTQIVNTNAAKAFLPSAAGFGLTPTEWLMAVFYNPTNIFNAAQNATMLQILPGCPDESTFDPPSFTLTGPASGTFTAGQTVTIQWTAANVDAGSSISLAYDTTSNWGNPKWIEIGGVARPQRPRDL